MIFYQEKQPLLSCCRGRLSSGWMPRSAAVVCRHVGPGSDLKNGHLSNECDLLSYMLHRECIHDTERIKNTLDILFNCHSAPSSFGWRRKLMENCLEKRELTQYQHSPCSVVPGGTKPSGTLPRFSATTCRGICCTFVQSLHVCVSWITCRFEFAIPSRSTIRGSTNFALNLWFTRRSRRSGCIFDNALLYLSP